MDANEKGGQAANKTLGKDTEKFNTQYKKVYQSFRERPKTMLQVSIETGILRANICRYVAKMRSREHVQVIRMGLCPYTHFEAGFYSTDESLFKKSDVSQLKLFSDAI
ncbi:MAG: hypothetical protein FWF09_00135 [Bacteroidales bacterium]|nr:hypothetical protein [Bacteroidales bacterium]